MLVGVELLTLGIDRLDAVSRERLPQSAEHHLDSGGKVLTAPIGQLQSSLEVVDSIDDFPSNFDLAPCLRSLDVPSYALTEILEVGFGPPGQFEVLLFLSLGVSQQRIEILLNLIRLSRG
ncbi:MAG TPA: hypothetical protein VFU11_11135 [Solirubrobacterales bacterium]|nr:hypothetical protein [Solirubrobacterales bacterium]